jgi:hypothetical protein
VKRLGTGDRYCATSDGVQQVAWANQEPPSIDGGECQNHTYDNYTLVPIIPGCYTALIEGTNEK